MRVVKEGREWRGSRTAVSWCFVAGAPRTDINSSRKLEQLPNDGESNDSRNE